MDVFFLQSPPTAVGTRTSHPTPRGAEGRPAEVILLQDSGSVPRRSRPPDVHPVDAPVPRPVDQPCQRAVPRLNPQNEPAAPVRHPPAGEAAAQAEAPAPFAQPADAVPPQQVDDDLHADADARLPRSAAKDHVSGRPGAPARCGPAPDHAAVRHDHGPAPPEALGAPAGGRGRLVAGRPARVPEPALAPRREMAPRDVQAAAVPRGPVGAAGPARRPAPALFRPAPARTLGPFVAPPVGAPVGRCAPARGLGRGRRPAQAEEEGEEDRGGHPGSERHGELPSTCDWDRSP